MSRRTVRPAVACATLLPLLLAACAVDQQADVDTWRREVTMGPVPQLAPGAPLPLSTAIRLANEQNERIAIGGEDFVQAIAERARITAGFFPEVAAGADYTFRERANSGVPFLDQSSLLDVPVRARWSFSPFRTGARAQSTALTVEQRRALLLDLRETVLLEVVQAYYRVLRAERREAVLASSLELQQQREREAEARLRIGTGRALDLAQARAQVARTRVQWIDARYDQRTGREALALLTGADVHASALRDDFALPAELPPLAALLATAQRDRQDLRAAALAAEAAREEVDVAIGQYYPAIGVNFDWFLSRESLPTDRDWTGLLALELPLFTAGRIHAEARVAWSRFREEVLRFSLLRRAIAADLADGLAQVDRLADRLRELRLQARADAEAVRLAEAGERAGRATSLERITAQDQLQQAELQIAEAELQRKVAWLELLRLLGGLAAGTTDANVAPPPLPRPVPDSPFVRLPGAPATTTRDP
jgi:outer membrane protein TolC